MGEAKRRAAKIGADGHYQAEGDAVEVAVAMLDIEARKDMPESARASAQFCRLIGPTLVEALDTIARRHGAALVLANLGTWLAELGVGSIVMQAEGMHLPPELLTEAIATNALSFQLTAFDVLADFERSRGRKPTKVSFK